MFPLFHRYMTLTVTGLEYLETVNPPVIFAANHTSHLDTIAIYAALPSKWRKRLAPAMMQEHFRAFFEKQRLFRKDAWSAGLQYMVARAVFNASPLPQQMCGVRRALEYTAERVGNGYCPLVYPEGTRTPHGGLLTFRPGIGMMAIKLGIPVVPIRLEGLFEIFPAHSSWPKRGPICVKLGKPLKFSPEIDYQSAARQIEETIRNL
jgi:long-chain acyl-CoA synthetase